MVFASSDVGIETIAVLGFDATKLSHVVQVRSEGPKTPRSSPLTNGRWPKGKAKVKGVWSKTCETSEQPFYPPNGVF